MTCCHLSATPAGTSEHDKLCRARDQCRDILKYVNEAVKRAENRHRLEGYQKRLDATSLERTSNPLAAEFKVVPAPRQGAGGGSVRPQPVLTTVFGIPQSLDLTSRRMIHEGPLTWRISKDKTVGTDLLHRPVPGALGDFSLRPQRPPGHGNFISSPSGVTRTTVAPRLSLLAVRKEVPPGLQAHPWLSLLSLVSSPTPDLHVLLLEDLLVLLQKQDEKLVLKCHSKTALGSSDNKQTFSPVLKLNSVLIRSVATGRDKIRGEKPPGPAVGTACPPAVSHRGHAGDSRAGGVRLKPSPCSDLPHRSWSPHTDKRALFIICTSELGPQIYELVALTSSDKNA